MAFKPHFNFGQYGTPGRAFLGTFMGLKLHYAERRAMELRQLEEAQALDQADEQYREKVKSLRKPRVAKKAERP